MIPYNNSNGFKKQDIVSQFETTTQYFYRLNI